MTSSADLPHAASVAAAAPSSGRLAPEERVRVELENRRLLERDLEQRSLVFASRPYDAIVQFSNYCNMSCVMCWDGGNPPVRRMTPALLQALSEQVAPSLSVVLPYYGSEPLVLTWDETRRLAETYSLQLSIATNVEFLDERRFRELIGITETLYLSIDSHDPETYARIRPGSRPDRVFANLSVAARLSREHGIECIANVVFLTENAEQLPETVAFLGDAGVPSVCISQVVDMNGRSSRVDPLVHMSAEDVCELRARCLDAARAMRLRLIWSVGGSEVHDFRGEGRIGPTARKAWNDAWHVRFERLHPRYCKFALKSVRIDVEGEVTPCCYASDGELSLGNLLRAPFDAIWNGREAQDLRRGMLCGDVPALCESCRFRDPVRPAAHLLFVDHVDVLLQRSLLGLEASLVPLAPAHAVRHRERPRLRLRDPIADDAEYFLALSPGGEIERIETSALAPERRDDGSIEFEFPADVWRRLESNVGYWWTVIACPRRAPHAPRRTSEIRCVLRHEDLPRVSGSRLRYADERRAPVRDLGGMKEASWSGVPESARARQVAP